MNSTQMEALERRAARFLVSVPALLFSIFIIVVWAESRLTITMNDASNISTGQEYRYEADFVEHTLTAGRATAKHQVGQDHTVVADHQPTDNNPIECRHYESVMCCAARFSNPIAHSLCCSMRDEGELKTSVTGLDLVPELRILAKTCHDLTCPC